MTFRDSGDIPAPAGYLSQDDFHALMDRTFGAGKWHETGGFRSQARENALRAAGAQTVAPGAVSAHSLGSPDAPGAHDVVVDGLTPAQVAQHLAASGPGVRNTFPEGSAGGQGAHLHLGMEANTAPTNFRSAGDVQAVATFRSPGDTPAVADDDWRKTRALVGGVVSGAGKLVHNLSELAGSAVPAGFRPAGLTRADMVEQAAQAAAPVSAAIEKTGDEIAPANRSGLESFAHGAGEMAPALGAAVADPLLGAAAFGAQGFGQAHDEALAAGATPETADTAGGENALIQGGLGMLPAGEVLKPLAAGVKGAIPALAARMGLAATGDAALGASMQTGANLVARQNYDPTRAWYDQVPQSAAMMAGGGLAVHGTHEAIGAAKGALRPPETVAAAEPTAQAPAAAASAGEMPPTDAIRAYAGHGPTEDTAPPIARAPGEPPPEAAAPAPAEPAPRPQGGGGASAPITEGEPVLFNTADGVAHGRVEAVAPGEAGQPDKLMVRTPVGRVTTTSVNAVALPVQYETARVAHGAPLEQMPQAISDVRELRQAAPKNYSLFQAIRDLGGIRTKDAQGQPDSDLGTVFDGVRPQPGVINNQSGLTPDAMREALQQRGWFGDAAPTEIAGDKNPGDSVEDLTRLMTREASGRANRVYHPTVADQELRRGDLEDQMQRAGVAADAPLPEAAAKLAAWRGEQVRAEGPEIARLRARAAELGETGLTHASYDETLADVVEAEAIHGDASEEDADHYENLIDGDLTPDEHEWLASARQGADGEPGSAFPFEGAGEGPGPGAGAPQGDLEPGAGAGGGGENPREGAAPRADALSETAVLRSSADQIGPGGVFAPHEPGIDALFETAEAPASNGASFLAKPRDLGAAQMRDMLPLAQRYGGRYAMRLGQTSFRFPTAEARDGFMRDATDGGTKFARAPVFYSAVERLIDRSPMKAASPEQWKATLKNAPGIKQEELQWTGVGDWLDLFPKGEKVPKEKLAAFLHENGVKVDEAVRGGEPPAADVDALTEQYADRERERMHENMDGHGHSEAEVDEYIERQINQMWGHLHDQAEGVIADNNAAAFEEWTLPGGKDYRELLLTLPKEASPPATHWDTPGVMAHVRFDERAAPDGKKVLFVEEIQSDWHQKGRDQGYEKPASKEEIAAAQQLSYEAERRLQASREAWLTSAGELWKSVFFDEPPWAKEQSAAIRANIASGRLRSVLELRPGADAPVKAPHAAASAAHEVHQRAILARNEANQALERAKGGGGIPDAPFKTSWPALVMKRVIRWAVDNGFERVAWTTGEQQADRYDLQKHVGRVVLQDNSTGGVGRANLAGPFEHGVAHIWDPEGNRVLERHVRNRDELNDLVGKEMAEKLLQAPANHARSAGLGVRERELSGLDVKIGGEGMKAFYDRNLVNITNDLIKKHGGKVEMLPVDLGVKRREDGFRDIRDQHSFDITPKLREAVEGGQPLFKRGEASRAGGQATSGVILPGMPRGVEMRRYDNPTTAQTALINKVHDAIGRIAPFAEMHPAASIHDLGYGEVLGFSHQSGLRHLIAWSLEAPAIARHEAVHALKTAGLFRPEEWGALVEAAQTEGWIDEFNVASRYGDLPIPGQIEEAIADRFAQFDADGRKGLPGLAGAAMRKIGQALDHVRDLVRQFRRLNPDWRDVFSRMERGEIGARFGEDLRDVGAPVGDVRFARDDRVSRRDILRGGAALAGSAPGEALARSVRTPIPREPFERVVRSGDAKAAVNWIARNSKNPLRRTVAEKLLRGGLGRATIEVVDGARSGDRYDGVAGQTTERDGSSHIAIIARDGAENGLTEETVLHEAIHAWLAARFRSLSTYLPQNRAILKTPTKSGDVAVDSFLRMWQGWRAAMEDKHPSLIDTTGTYDDKETNKLLGQPDPTVWGQQMWASPDEAMVRALTDPNAQAFLKGHDLQGNPVTRPGTSMWDRFVQWLGGLFGVKTEDRSAFAKLLDASNAILDAGTLDNPDFSYANAVRSRIEASTQYQRTSRATERDARQRAAQREIDEREGRAPTVVTRLLGNGVDAVGNRATDALERFLPESVQDIGAEVRMALNPMAAGSERAQAEAKDFANGLREIAYSHGKVDEWLAKTFTPEQRRRMYDAADEERVLRGRGQEPGPGEGKNRLNDDLRRVVDQLQARADNAFARAQELGMVKGEGQQSYVPAMLVDVSGGMIRRLKGGKGATGGRGNLSTTTGQLRQRQHETAEETQAAAQRGFGQGATVVHDIRTLNLATGKLEQAMAGRRLINKIREIGRQVGEVTVSDGAMPEANAYFTMPEHPAMVTWGPKFEKDAATGKLVTVDGPDGKPVMEAKPLYIAKEFEGPLKAVLSRPDSQLWRKLMDVKGKMMSVTMYNPLLHNMVIYGKAFPAMVAHDKLGAFTFKTYRDGALVKKDPELMSRALRSGTVPIGHQGGFQDITSIASEDPVTPGKSWTAQLLAATLGMGSAGRKLAIKRGVDRAGDIWHNEFLWNRVSDLQMGLWKAMSDHFQKQGLDQVTADRSASYFANMYAGSVPVEAMSRLARGLLNGVLFSRSFHVTNIGGLKAMTAGLPTDVQAQIMRDAPAMLAKAQGMVRSKAIGSLVTDFIAAWAARMIAAGALAWLLNRAFQAPGDNEEGKKDRVFVGYGPDGTASYMRLPFGKYVEEVKDWFSEPVTYAKQIMFGPTRLALQYLSNDMGFGRKAYDPYDKSLAGLGKNLWKFVGNLGSSFLPVDHGQQLWDAATKSGQARDDATAALAGDLTGFTISHGAPGGPAMGDIFRAEDEHQYRVTEEMPEIRKQIKAGDVLGARAKMTALGIPPGLANYYVKVARNPNARMTGRKLADFNRIATPEQKAQLATDRAAAAARRQEAVAP